MEWYWILLALFGSILLLMFAGLPVGIAFIAVNTVAAFFIFGRFGDFDTRVQSAIGQHVDNAFGNMTIFAIVPIPMFLLMGELFFHTGLANRMFDAVEKLMGRVPGAVVLRHGGRRHRLRHALRLVDGLHRTSRHADGPGDGRARLQEEHVDRPDTSGLAGSPC